MGIHPRVSTMLAVTLVLLFCVCISRGASEFQDVARPFIEEHCVSCHGEKKAKAGFRIDLLGSDFGSAKAADQWKEVIDRINAGEMPPDDKSRPDAKLAAGFVNWVDGKLHAMEMAAMKAGGRIPMRRLNRDEYANTVRDLLRLDENVIGPLVEDLPADGRAEGFDRLGAALFFDQTQVERSLAVAERIAARAIVAEAPQTNRMISLYNEKVRQSRGETMAVAPGLTHTIPRGAQLQFGRSDHVEIVSGPHPTYRKEYVGWGAVGVFSISKVVTQDGYYRFRIKATVDNRGRTAPNKFRLQYGKDSPIEVENEVAVDPSGMSEVLMFLRGPVNGELKGPQVFYLHWNHTEQAVILEPNYEKLTSQWKNIGIAMERAAVERKSQPEMDALRKQRAETEKALNAWTGPAYICNPKMDFEKLPRLKLESIEVEGPIEKDWPPVSHKMLFFAGDERQGVDYAREIFARLLPRAYRRAVTAEEIESIVSVVTSAQNNEKLSFAEAMRIGLQRVLCAPGFLFLEEPSGSDPERWPVTDYELASRLSYFLWSTMPDDELLQLAAKDKLHKPAMIATQLKRMIADPKSQQFVRNFCGQWLAVRDYGSIQPAADYRDYDKILERASKEEPYAFFTEVLTKNLPITNFINSDFLVVNERLAKHYGLKGVKGDGFRTVAITPENHRGGVLGMAGLMTFLADGTRTLPMRRGSWVLRELFNDPPNNPPSNAGEIQPNTAGKNLTVRERIELHRRDEICASCHFKLDPYGLALENYDAIGQWRERANGEGFKGSLSPVLDVSGAFPNGEKFSSLEEYKAVLTAQKDKFARALCVKMLTYAIGRPVSYTDHGDIDALADALKQNDYRIQSLITAIVNSEPFNTK